MTATTKVDTGQKSTSFLTGKRTPLSSEFPALRSLAFFTAGIPTFDVEMGSSPPVWTPLLIYLNAIEYNQAVMYTKIIDNVLN